LLKICYIDMIKSNYKLNQSLVVEAQ
jgi:hypothetical protein